MHKKRIPAEPRIGFTISWIARTLRTRFDARARAIGLTRAQWTMMMTIAVAEGATQSEIASRLEINTVTAGRIIDRLEEAGWVERRPDLADRRANRLFLTPAATPMMETLSALGLEEERISLKGLSAAERVTLGGLLDRVIANMVEASPVCSSVDDGDDLVASSGLGD